MMLSLFSSATLQTVIKAAEDIMFEESFRTITCLLYCAHSHFWGFFQSVCVCLLAPLCLPYWNSGGVQRHLLFRSFVQS